MKNLIVLLGVATLLSSCGSDKKQVQSTETLTGEVRIDGSSTVYPVSEAIAEDFQAANPKVRITVGESGTGGGFKKFGRGDVDFTNASRPIKPTEVELCRENNIEYIELPIAYDGLAVVVHPENTWVDKMTVNELKMLWEPAAQGKIKRWNQIRASWPNQEIHLFGAGTQSGTFDYFTEAITGKSKESRGDFTASEDDNILVQGISSDKLALGYFGLAYYEANKDKLKLIPIDDENDDNGSGGIVPTQETVRNGTYQPLSRPLFVYINVKSLERAEVRAFAEFMLANAAELSREVGYIPLPDEVNRLVQDRFANRITGSVFEGGSDVGIRIEDLLKEVQ